MISLSSIISIKSTLQPRSFIIKPLIVLFSHKRFMVRHYSTTIDKSSITEEMILNKIMSPFYGKDFEHKIIEMNPSYDINGLFEFLYKKTYKFCKESKLLHDFGNQYQIMKAQYIWDAYQTGKIKLNPGWFPENNNKIK